ATDKTILEQYDQNEHYAKDRIDKEEGQTKYQIHEVQLSDDERKKLKEIGELLVEELDVDIKKLGTNENAAAYIRKLVEKIIKNYKIKVTPDALDRLMYYIVRDFVHFDKIDPMMRDPWIEDISCNGFGIPIYIWHRKYESIPTTINTLAMFIKPNAKIVSIEDTSEIQLPHENWLSSVVRAGFGVTGEVSEITLFDLLKNAMRQRPEYIIVGEVRGSEAYTLMQAIATGHGGLATLHADYAEGAIHRLESEPMNIPRPRIPT